jgi:hypothetical protein
MAKIYVHSPFTLKHGEQTLEFGVGVYTVDQDVAGHWYALLHIGAEPEAGKFDNDEAADALLSELETKSAELALAKSALDEREVAVQAKESEISSREAAVKVKEDATAKSSKTTK